MKSASATAVPLDEATTAAIREALAAAQSGRLAEACDRAERALSQGGDVVALNALLGMLLTRAGDAVGAVPHLETAHQARPEDPHIATNLAGALMTSGNYARALQILTDERAGADDAGQLLRMRGYAAQMSGDFETAVDAYEQVIAATPDDWETLNNLGNAKLATGDLEGAIDSLKKSAKLNPNAAPTRLNLARTLRMVGRMDEAERELRAMADDFPDDAQALIDLHDLLVEQDRDRDVVETLERAIRRSPGRVDLMVARGRQLGLQFQMESSEAAFREALELDPRSDDAFIGLATIYEHRTPDDIKRLAVESEENGASAATTNLLWAFYYRRAKKYAEGLEVIGRVPKDFETARREELLGQFLDRLERYDEAFAAFTRMNDAQADDPSQPLAKASYIRSMLRERIELTTGAWTDSWNAPPLRPERPAPVFLVGFPRSGTTLLDTMLMGHAGVAVLEERPVLTTIGSQIGGVQGIETIDESRLRQAQRDYFAEAAKYAEINPDTLIIDKSPLHLNAVPLIYRLFPDARFILALRHPADAVLSCFINNFRLNPSMSNFVRLDTSAEFYDLTFTMWETSRGIFPIDVHSVRYEDLVDDPAVELRRLSDALGLSWDETMVDHQKTAANRGVITTASYAQVTEPIYRRSLGRWRHYRKHLEPILPILQPWIERFGYSL